MMTLLLKGIPEIGLPPMDPLILPEVIVFKGGHGQMKAIGRQVKITGISNAKITYLKYVPNQIGVSSIRAIL